MTGLVLDGQAGKAEGWPEADWLGPGGSRREVGGVLALVDNFRSKWWLAPKLLAPAVSILTGVETAQ